MQAEMLDSVVSSNSQELPNASSALKLSENPQFGLSKKWIGWVVPSPLLFYPVFGGFGYEGIRYHE